MKPFKRLARAIQRSSKFAEFDRAYDDSAPSMKAAYLVSRGIGECRSGNDEFGEADFEEAIQLSPAHLPAYTALAQMLLQQNRSSGATSRKGERARAIELLSTAVGITTLCIDDEPAVGLSEAYRMLALAHLLGEDGEQALPFAQKAMDALRREQVSRVGGLAIQAGLIPEGFYDEQSRELQEMIDFIVRQLGKNQS